MSRHQAVVVLLRPTAPGSGQFVLSSNGPVDPTVLRKLRFSIKSVYKEQSEYEVEPGELTVQS